MKQFIGWRHLVNWGRTLSIGGILIGIPLLCVSVFNGNSMMTGAADSDVWNIGSTSVTGFGAVVSFIVALISTWMSTGRISPTDATVEQSFKNLAVLALDSPTAAHLLQQLKAQIAPPKDSQAVNQSTTLLSSAEYLQLLEKSIRQEISQACLK